MQKPLICLMFDREGGALARFGADYWHGYDDMERLALDLLAFAQSGDTGSLPRNEKNDYGWPEPNRRLIDRGQAVWFDYDDIMELADSGRSVPIGDVNVFLRALRSRIALKV